jgi:hypothetical protein
LKALQSDKGPGVICETLLEGFLPKPYFSSRRVAGKKFDKVP